jgi:hypothetical protein
MVLTLIVSTCRNNFTAAPRLGDAAIRFATCEWREIANRLIFRDLLGPTTLARGMGFCCSCIAVRRDATQEMSSRAGAFR